MNIVGIPAKKEAGIMKAKCYKTRKKESNKNTMKLQECMQVRKEESNPAKTKDSSKQ